MNEYKSEKVIIVEGKSDKKKIAQILRDPVEIICTNGTVSIQKIEEIVDEFDLFHKEVYILADADYAGEKLRKQFKKELPNAIHIYIDKMFREVANTPDYYLALALLSKNFNVNPKFLIQ
ncbi:toprim domain-containing protein [Calidifontibacillus erzurumensis]|uniref:Toprim domain-containing protein n=1 Tax=Calidifontibacillus erzurumensis TaxID=2741433 RepID=A0A8J8GJK9_9BACI|nr:toprim domain-containing protein [Calidifontibacillus erzurumensis]NSL52948.1 hypothetical protein [Calidifontibacillus erzurumensis]